MRTRGWAGNPPRDDNEARERVLAAAMRCVDRFGPDKTRLVDVADELGVTRQTVYRYYPSVAEMLVVVAQTGLDQFLDRMEAALSHVSTPVEAATEAMVFTLQTLPNEPYLGLLLRAGENELFSRGATSSMALSLGVKMLHRLNVNWEDAGFDEARLEGLAELTMRLFLSFLQYPTDPPRSTAELRAFITEWIGPAISPQATSSHL